MTLSIDMIHDCVFKYELCIPTDLAKWLLVEYGDEPYEGFWDADVLQELIRLHHDAYWNGMLDTELPDAYTILKHRYESLKDLITDLRDDISILEEENDTYLTLLQQHGIQY